MIPQVTIASIHGPFGQLFLAEELHKRGALAAVVDTRPWWKAKKKHPWLPRSKYLAMPLIEYGRQIRMQFVSKVFSYDDRLLTEIERTLFAKWIARVIPEADIQIFLVGSALESLNAAKREGRKTIVFNNSTHIDNAVAVLTEEARVRGLREPKYFSQWFRKRVLDEYELADFIRVPAEIARQSFLDRGFSPEKVRVIPHGYEIDVFQPHPKRDDIFRVLFFATVSYRKGVPYLFEAFRRANIQKSELLLVGGLSSEIRPFLKAIDIPFRSLGYVPWKDLAPIISQCSVSVLLSLEEGSAGTLGQAMACGVPVVATRAAGAEPLIRNGIDGYVVDLPQNVECVADCLRELALDESKRRSMAANALGRVSSFTWKNHADEMWKWFTEIVPLS